MNKAQGISWRALIGWTLLLGLVLGGASIAVADGAPDVELRAELPHPKSSGSKLQRLEREKMAEEAIRRMKERFKAAELKFARAEFSPPEDISIQVGGEINEGAVAGIAFAPGRFAIRPVKKQGSAWLKRSGAIPTGIELKQPMDSLQVTEGYLWSASRQTLNSFVEGVSFNDGLDTFVYVDDGGWRTVTLGEPVVTEENVTETAIRQVNTGTPYVAISFDGDGAGEMRARMRRDEATWAAVLDGEVISLFETGNNYNRDVLTLPAPQHISSPTKRTNWARQVAGRLAAPMPIGLRPYGDTK